MKPRYLPALVWAAVIFISSSTVVTRKQWLATVQAAAPSAAPEQVHGFWERYWWVFVKGYHFLEFFVLATLLVWAFPKTSRLIVLGVAALYAVTDEVHQLWVPARGGRWEDVLIDSAGATLGVLVAPALISRFSKKSKSLVD